MMLHRCSGDKNSTRLSVITSEILKGQVILPIAFAMKDECFQDECFGKNYSGKSYYIILPYVLLDMILKDKCMCLLDELK